MMDYFADFGAAVKASEGYNQPFLVNWRKKPMPVLGDSPKYGRRPGRSEHLPRLRIPGQADPGRGRGKANWIVCR